jgi:hypothetical protein
MPFGAWTDKRQHDRLMYGHEDAGAIAPESDLQVTAAFGRAENSRLNYAPAVAHAADHPDLPIA